MKKVELILVISLIIVFVSGFLLHPFHDVHIFKIVHALSGAVVMICAILHIKRCIRMGKANKR